MKEKKTDKREFIEITVGKIYVRMPATKFYFKQARMVLKAAEKYYLGGKI